MIWDWNKMKDHESYYLGLISGTSADAIDVALLQFDQAPRVVATMAFEYPTLLRKQILDLNVHDAKISLDDLGSLDTQIGQVFARSALTFIEHYQIPKSRILGLGSHGQTVRHKPRALFPFSMQLGNPHVIAEITGITTVADFRQRDVAAGGEGAPLLPAFHAMVFANNQQNQAVLNLGGIANLTLLPSKAEEKILGFDTGPANCLIDAWLREHHDQPYDRGGQMASEGKIHEGLVQHMLQDPYFFQLPPKSTGREYFQLQWLAQYVDQLAQLKIADVLATLVEVSVQSIVMALHRHAPDTHQLWVCGGGVHNHYLMQRLAAQLKPMMVQSTAQCGVDPDFIEAAAFAWLARETLLSKPGNLPSVTGARGLRVLGAVFHSAN
jgi:anhydro-N-acetylmuramic acid kinase